MSVIFVGGLDSYLLKVAAGLIGRGVPLTCFLDRYNDPALRDPIFKAVQKIDANRFRYPEKILALNHETTKALPAALIENFRRCESVFLSLGDRYGFNVPVIDRKILYHELLLYFYRWLSRGNYRLIIFPNVPHDVWNYVLYCVAKQLGIRTLILEETLIADRVILWDDHEKIPATPDDFLAGQRRLEIMELLPQQIRDELFDRSAGLQEATENNQRALQIPGTLVLTWLLIQQLAESLLVMASRVLWRQPAARIGDKSVLILNWPGNEARIAVRRYAVKMLYRRLYFYYERSCERPEPNQPYILFFLNYQPEKKTTPMGGVFEDQYMAVRMLSQGVPAGWQIYMREHPLQFKGSLDSQYYRSRVFYDRLRRLPNVRLISVHDDHRRLLAGAVCTATVAGSVGWEGLLVGKASLVFGRPWYTGCRSCYHVTSVKECREALRKVQDKGAATVELDVLRWLVFVKQRLLIGVTSDRVGARSRRGIDELGEALAEGLAPYILKEVA